MKANSLRLLSMAKYERLLPRIFPDANGFELRTRQGEVVWNSTSEANGLATNGKESILGNTTDEWTKHCHGIDRCQIMDGAVMFRTALVTQSNTDYPWLIVSFDTRHSSPLSIASHTLRSAFSDASILLQEEIELQSECNLLAIELTERYEELNLVYSTKDQVEYFEEGQEALVRLVHNCADYLNVELAALICRDRALMIHHSHATGSAAEVENVLALLGSSVYDRVESQVRSVVLNDMDSEERNRIFAGRSENIVAYPVIDDHGTAIGLLAVVARRETHTFSNGDRNLLEVMAKKASRIIHTHHDSLTGLMNRSGFESSLVSTLSSARNKNLQHCLLHIDFDQLHVVNDLMGYQEGDGLLRRVAKALRGVLRDSDYVARMGGDEFGVLLCNCSVAQGQKIADKIRTAVNSLTVANAQRQLDVSVSIGISSLTKDTDGIVGVMASAEIACKAAKDAGRDCIQVFEEDNTILVKRSEEIEWIGRVQQALREDEFVLYCQPVVPLANEKSALHFEILVRMRDQNGDILAPGYFMPAAERYQLMPMVDRWIIRNTLNVLSSSWQCISTSEPVFCINLSGQSLTNAGFLAFVTDEIEQSGIPHRNICFEITETAAISNIDEATVFMNALRQMGCLFSLDDFGAGLSSFGYLKVLPVDYLKIDGSFVREITTDDVSLSMVTAIYQIGKTMGLSTVAEFVENQETIQILKTIGVDYIQGFGIGKPVPLDQTIKRLSSDTTAASA